MRGRSIVTVAVVALVVTLLVVYSDSSIMHMQVGQCILLSEDKSAIIATTVDEIGCTGEHGAEASASASVPDRDFPGAETFNRQIETEYISAFDAYVGSDYSTSSSDAAWVISTRDSWAQND